MLYKILLCLFPFFLFSSSLSVEDHGKFAGMACKLIGHNRSVVHCELQQKQIVVTQTTDGKELKLLCVWAPQTTEDEYILDETSLSLLKEVDKVLIGYGQASGNPMFYYYLPSKKVTKKVKIDKLDECRIPLSLCDFQF